MNKQAVILLVDAARARADAGIDYSSVFGAVCPECGKEKIPTITSRPWKDNMKIRYHKCDNTDCIICRMGLSMKSFQAIND